LISEQSYQADVSSLCKRNGILLAFFFLMGLLGGAAAWIVSGHPVSLMRGAFPAVSIVRPVFCSLFPFLISFAVSVFDPVFLIPVCFCRAFLFSYIHCGIRAALYPWGFFWRWSYCSSFVLSLPLYYLFCHRRLCLRRGVAPELLIVLAVVCIGIFDQLYFVPALMALS